MKDFQSFDLPQPLTSAIERMGYTTPTPIQAKVIPIILIGRDILASSHTGSGKTGAFAIPIVAKISTCEHDTALILTPTRELATQVMEIVKELTRGQTLIRAALLIGGAPMVKQYAQLKFSPRIIVGTPGRVNDHLKRKTLKLSNAKFIVLDETDRMLDMGFGVQIDTILKHVTQSRQTLMFSATISKQIERLSKNYLTNPEYVKIGEHREVAPNLVQKNVHVADRDKYATLLEEIERREGSILVFVGTKHGAQKIADRLSADGHEALAIHGDLRQRQRDRVMKSFHGQRNRIMIATDVASRGLDVPHIEHVINYDLPQMAEDYIHRIGRTARAGKSGSSLSFISPKDSSKWKSIEKMLKGGEPEPFVKFKAGTRSKFGRTNGGNSRDFKAGSFKRNERFGEDKSRRDASHKASGYRNHSTDSGSSWEKDSSSSADYPKRKLPSRNEEKAPRKWVSRNNFPGSPSNRTDDFGSRERSNRPAGAGWPQKDRGEKSYFTTTPSEGSAGNRKAKRPFNKLANGDKTFPRSSFGKPKKFFARKPFGKANKSG